MDLSGFDLKLLKAFDALYAERHVTHAGQRIGLSQSAMSGALTRLREVFQDELFVRSAAGMLPTPRADDLAGPVSAALRLMRAVLQTDGFKPATADHTVTIAMNDYAAFVLLPPHHRGLAAPPWWCRVTGGLEILTAALIAFPAGRVAGMALGAVVIAVAIVAELRRREFSHAAPLGVFAALLAFAAIAP